MESVGCDGLVIEAAATIMAGVETGPLEACVMFAVLAAEVATKLGVGEVELIKHKGADIVDVVVVVLVAGRLPMGVSAATVGTVVLRAAVGAFGGAEIGVDVRIGDSVRL